MRIWSLDEILKTENLGNEKYVRVEEIERLNSWVNDLQAGMYVNCVYCGHRYGAETEVPASMADVLKEHIEQCPEHPLFEARQEIERLETCNEGLRIQGKDFIKEIEQLRKENDYLLTLCAGPITGCMTNLDEAKKWVETNMRQALKEK